MYFDDHPPPHFHVITNDDRECVYRIDTLELWEWAAANHEELYGRWLEYSEQE